MFKKSCFLGFCELESIHLHKLSLWTAIICFKWIFLLSTSHLQNHLPFLHINLLKPLAHFLLTLLVHIFYVLEKNLFLWFNLNRTVSKHVYVFLCSLSLSVALFLCLCQSLMFSLLMYTVSQIYIINTL